jgi:hypothetical protein
MPKSDTKQRIREELRGRNIVAEVVFIATDKPGWYIIRNDCWSGRSRIGCTCEEALSLIRNGTLDHLKNAS